MKQSSQYRIYLEKELPMLENLLGFYRKSAVATKKKIPGCIFSEKLILAKGKLQPVKRNLND
jgi:site-specific DNA recombinase